MLEEFTNDALFHYAIIFARLGSIFLFIPGFGESYVSPRARLSLGILCCLIFYPILHTSFPPMPQDLIEVFLVLVKEVTIGIFIGLTLRVIQSILHMTGMKIAFMCGLSTATLFDANQSTQGSVIGGFLSVIGITLFFTTELHHIVLMGFVESYEVFKISEPIAFDHMAQINYRLIADMFVVAFKISTPIIITGLLLYLSAGLMGRLMPSMQVFFVLMPVQIYAGLLFLGFSLSIMMLTYINFYQEFLQNLLAP